MFSVGGVKDCAILVLSYINKKVHIFGILKFMPPGLPRLWSGAAADAWGLQNSLALTSSVPHTAMHISGLIRKKIATQIITNEIIHGSVRIEEVSTRIFYNPKALAAAPLHSQSNPDGVSVKFFWIRLYLYLVVYR